MSLRFYVKRALLGGVIALASTSAWALYWNSSSTDLKMQLFGCLTGAARWTDPENAHLWAVWAGKKGFFPRDGRADPVELRTHFCGKIYMNPIGLAAGFDKNAETVQGMLDLGLGFVEVGSVTPLPQEGNPKPRVFRIPEQKAVINRYGFNSDGAESVAKRLDAFRKNNTQSIIGVNLGVNKENASDWRSALRDYSLGMRVLAKYADYIVINVSSPNTQGMLYTTDHRGAFRWVRDQMDWGNAVPPPLFVKISPDLAEEDKKDIAKEALNGHLDGLVVSNTTISRNGMASVEAAREAGGLSGRPLFDPSTALLKEMYILTKGSVPLIGCGGISTGKQAYEKIKAGATLVQLYTSLIYEGPALVPRIKSELAECLKQDNHKDISEAVGTGHKA